VDFSPFKPVYIPEDNPANFDFFFDTSMRRYCNLAPERFYSEQTGYDSKGNVTPEMDVFSIG